MLFVESDSESVNNTDICQVEDSFTASTTQIAHLSDIFQSLVSINNQAIIRIKETGIAIYSSYNHTFNVNVNIDPSLFSIYSITGEEFTLGVDLSLIGECFTSVAIIEFEDTYILEKLEFYTYIIESGMEDDNLGIDYERVEMEAMVRSDVLTNILSDLWQIDTENLFIYAEADTLTFISNGPIGTSKLIFPNDKDVLEKLEISGDKSHHQHDGAQPRRVYDWVDRGAREAGVVYVVQEGRGTVERS
ncbi:Repair protein Rad1/Rec1/Rad17 family protein [Candida albicans]|uniref:Repair protein Rad1/Rec1/Rad17 family protein n=1 Tax=Candida albicans TaxID=5476 RepID=A0A8H6C2J9_CANAX|nr:Repair protein Rad1/Rec1/Rad17 family protein [Candida albicans]